MPITSVPDPELAHSDLNVVELRETCRDILKIFTFFQDDKQDINKHVGRLARSYKGLLMRQPYQSFNSFCMKNIQEVKENIFSEIENLSYAGYTFDAPLV
ncbi:unnamed protein product [Macrosiphum euphorbiae]|uniref:Uncharacterized protein n=1 Tax=Macrosiphum euphorbiae TaxID=13131 RepID=A0AAV0VV03_9HEMI|nr:unnamed protein product [Macrosiphum euphorbiae]